MVRIDGQPVVAPQQLLCLPVEVKDDLVPAADDEQRGRGHVGQPWCGEVGAAAPGDDRVDVPTGLGRCP